MANPFLMKPQKILREGVFILAIAVACAACSGSPDAGDTSEDSVAPVETDNMASTLSPLCATADEAAQVATFYYQTRPGAVLPIPGRKLGLVESKIASGLPHGYAVGVDGTPDRLAEIWRTIDAWGEDTNVRLVVSIDGWHPFDFPSTAPVTQAKHNRGFYDVYAKGDEGVHIHLKPDDVKLIYAANLPAPDGTASRTVSLYDSHGRLIIGVYASKAGAADFDEAAVAGFNGSWDVIEAMPRACAAKER